MRHHPGSCASWIMVVLACAASTACGDGGSVFGPADDVGNYEGGFESDGVNRTYFVHTPPIWEPGTALPLVIALHGVPGNGKAMRAITGLDSFADQYGFVVAYPSAASTEWAVGCDCTVADFKGINDVGFIRKVIEELESHLGIDRNRVFVAGYSQGALMAQNLACELPGWLAGAASVAATMLGPVANRCSPGMPVRTLFIHGTDDTQFPAEGLIGQSVSSLSIGETLNTWSQINGCSGNPSMAVEPDTADDGTTVERWTYPGCDPGGDLLFFSVQGGGHTWPGTPAPVSGLGRVSRDISASEVISRFFLF